MLSRVFIGPDSQTLMHAISSVKVDKSDNSYVGTHTMLPECALINCILLYLKHLYQQTIVFLSVLKQHTFQHVDVFMSLIGCLNPEHFMLLCC